MRRRVGEDKESRGREGEEGIWKEEGMKGYGKEGCHTWKTMRMGKVRMTMQKHAMHETTTMRGIIPACAKAEKSRLGSILSYASCRLVDAMVVLCKFLCCCAALVHVARVMDRQTRKLPPTMIMMGRLVFCATFILRPSSPCLS